VNRPIEYNRKEGEGILTDRMHKYKICSNVLVKVKSVNTYSVKNGSSNNMAAEALLSASGSKHRSIKFFALSLNSDGISGCNL